MSERRFAGVGCGHGTRRDEAILGSEFDKLLTRTLGLGSGCYESSCSEEVNENPARDL